MKKIEIEELKQLQCEVLKVAHEFCLENGLKYSLACGTLLGAIRHNGYIPWDDDIDIYMPREDYDKLIRVFPERYKSYYKLVSFERDKQWCRPYANLYDDRTLYEEHKSSIEKQIGVNIDIFPVDYVPDDEQEWLRFNKKRRVLILLHSAKYVAFRAENRALWKNVLLAMLKVVLYPIPNHVLVKGVDKYIRQYNGQSTHRLFESCCGLLQKRPFPEVDFSEVIPHVFENYEFNIMQGFDDYLTNGFGDYMTLPPIEKRISHHYFKAFWK